MLAREVNILVTCAFPAAVADVTCDGPQGGSSGGDQAGAVAGADGAQSRDQPAGTTRTARGASQIQRLVWPEATPAEAECPAAYLIWGD